MIIRKILLTFAVLLLSMPAAAQETAPAVEISPALRAQIEKIESYVASTRGLEALEPVERIFPSREDAIAYVLALYEREYPPEEVQRLTQFYAAFGLLPPGTDYLASYLDLLSAQIGGFYEPETKEMNVLLLNGGEPGDELPLLEQIVYAHEYVHALQDQHYNLTALQGLAGENRDHAQAILSLIEGDATVVMTLYTQEIARANPLGTAMRLLFQGIQTNTLTLPAGTPPIIESELLSAYLDGSNFVTELLIRGGWSAVDEAFADPPRSTEQILHPEKYLSREEPESAVLNDVVLQPGWEMTWDNTLGEFFLREYLQTQLSPLDAARGAGGWGGDRFQIFINADTGELAWTLKVAWDTREDVAEFDALYTKLGDEQFGAAADGDCWNGDQGALCRFVVMDEHIITFAPDLDMAQVLANGQFAPVE